MMMGNDDALTMLTIHIPDMVDEDVKDDEWVEQYQRFVNRVRYSLERDIDKKAVFHKGLVSKKNDFFTCPTCGRQLRAMLTHFCNGCGQRISWKGCGEEAGWRGTSTR